jgi:hypothetical protein
MVMHPHTIYHLERQKSYGPDNSLNEKVIVNWEKNIEILSFFGKYLYKIISVKIKQKSFVKFIFVVVAFYANYRVFEICL